MLSKVLVVDDEIAICKELRKFLEIRGWSVSEAYDGNQALEAYAQDRPDLVLLDVRMPGKDGLQVLRELKAIDPEARVIMITAVRDEEIARQARAEGALEYITKPIDPEYLGLAIETMLALSECQIMIRVAH